MAHFAHFISPKCASIRLNALFPSEFAYTEHKAKPNKVTLSKCDLKYMSPYICRVFFFKIEVLKRPAESHKGLFILCDTDTCESPLDNDQWEIHVNHDQRQVLVLLWPLFTIHFNRQNRVYNLGINYLKYINQNLLQIELAFLKITDKWHQIHSVNAILWLNISVHIDLSISMSWAVAGGGPAQINRHLKLLCVIRQHLFMWCRIVLMGSVNNIGNSGGRNWMYIFDNHGWVWKYLGQRKITQVIIFPIDK